MDKNRLLETEAKNAIRTCIPVGDYTDKEAELFLKKYAALSCMGYKLVELDLFWDQNKLPSCKNFEDSVCWCAFSMRPGLPATKVYYLNNFGLGYPGTGPSYLCHILEKMNVKFDKDLILGEAGLNATTATIHLHSIANADGSLTLVKFP